MIPIRDQPVGTVVSRLVGLAFGIIGLCLASLAGFMAWAQLESLGSIQMSVVVFLIVIVPIAWFCSTAGWRLALNRPNRYGSIVRPWAWRTLAIIFLALAIFLVVFASIEAKLLSAWPALGAVAFALMCFWRARMLGRLVKPELPSNKSLERTREE
jgi:hypothetical protein